MTRTMDTAMRHGQAVLLKSDWLDRVGQTLEQGAFKPVLELVG